MPHIREALISRFGFLDLNALELLALCQTRELLIDLNGNPGSHSEPDSLLNGPSTISISSPLRFPRFRQVEPLVDFRSLARRYFADCDSLNLVFEDSSSGDGDTGDIVYSNKQSDETNIDMNIVTRSPSNSN